MKQWICSLHVASNIIITKVIGEEKEQLLNDIQSKMKWVVSFKFKEKYMKSLKIESVGFIILRRSPLSIEQLRETIYSFAMCDSFVLGVKIFKIRCVVNIP